MGPATFGPLYYANPPLRDTRRTRTWSAPRWTNIAPTAKALATPTSRGCGLATDQKAVRTRGPGRV